MTRRILLALLGLTALLSLTACHVDNDPWPAGGYQVLVTATPMPTVSTAEPTENPALPPDDAAPLPEEADEAVEETRTPGGDEAPGLNG